MDSVTALSEMGEETKYGRSKVIEIINKVVASMDGSSGEALHNLAKELHKLVEVIDQTRTELSGQDTAAVGSEHVPTATDELDAVVEATASATEAIMTSCEAMQAAVAGQDGDVATVVNTETGKIFEECSFQDITGQRIKKVVTVLHEVETKVGNLLEMLGHDPKGNKLKVKQENAKPTDEDLMNGPQLPGNAMSQDDIDALLASFD